MIKVVLFDIDGVLIETTEANRKFVNDLLKKQGKTELNEKEYLKIRHMTIKQVIQEFCPEINEKKTEETRKYWSGKYKNYLGLTKINSGAKEILDYLKGKVKIGIVTNRTKTKILDYHKINDFFEVIITALDVKEPKPSPEGIKKALNKLKVKPIEAIFVGDAETDVQAGNSAGVKMISYQIELNGNAERIESFEELKKFIEWKKKIEAKKLLEKKNEFQKKFCSDFNWLFGWIH